MLLLVSGATKTLEAYPHPRLGRLIVPKAQNRPTALNLQPRRWAGDNGAFSAFDERAFLRMLDQFQGIPGCLFVTAPDVVGNATDTLRLFAHWESLIHRMNYPVAFVLQDGLEARQIPWRSCEAVFVGGTTEFKLGRPVRSFVGYARALGRWVHMGRVNSVKRLTYAAEIGCQSVDGTKYSRWPKVHLPLAIRTLNEIQSRLRLQ